MSKNDGLRIIERRWRFFSTLYLDRIDPDAILRVDGARDTVDISDGVGVADTDVVDEGRVGGATASSGTSGSETIVPLRRRGGGGRLIISGEAVREAAWIAAAGFGAYCGSC